MSAENNRRVRLEEKSATAEGRDRKKVNYPPAPLYDKKTKKVTYPGYSESVIKKYSK